MKDRILSIEVRVQETVRISGPASITLLEKSGSRARLEIRAAADVRIERPEKNSALGQALSGLAPRCKIGA